MNLFINIQAMISTILPSPTLSFTSLLQHLLQQTCTLNPCLSTCTCSYPFPNMASYSASLLQYLYWPEDDSSRLCSTSSTAHLCSITLQQPMKEQNVCLQKILLLSHILLQVKILRGSVLCGTGDESWRRRYFRL